MIFTNHLIKTGSFLFLMKYILSELPNKKIVVIP